jgi:hypothetical protein
MLSTRKVIYPPSYTALKLLPQHFLVREMIMSQILWGIGVLEDSRSYIDILLLTLSKKNSDIVSNLTMVPAVSISPVN